MRSKIYIYLISIVGCLLYSMLSPFEIKAQLPTPAGVSLSTDTTLFAANESIASLTLVINNTADEPFTGSVSLASVEGVVLLGREEIAIQAAAQSTIHYPIRLLVGKEVPAGRTQVQLNLKDINNIVQAQTITTLLIEAKQRVNLFSNQASVFMEHVGDSLSVSALLRNSGNSDELVNVTASFPNLTGGKKLVNKEIYLPAFQDSVIVFKYLITKELLSVDRYSVNIAALYGSGQLINNITVNVQNISGNRTYADPGYRGFSFDSYSRNRISVSGRNLFTDNEALQVIGNGLFNLQSGSLNFSIDGYFYTRGAGNPLINNTFIDYRFKSNGIMIGNITESLETFVNGRGVKLYKTFDNESKLVEAGLVDKSYNLLGDVNSLNPNNGYNAYVKTYINNQSNQQYYGSLVYDRTPFENTESFIAMNKYQYSFKNNAVLGLEIGGGLTRLLNDPSVLKSSIAVGNSFTTTIGKYNLYSNNFYSSAYYPGVRRGLIQLNERISRSFSRFNTWVSYSFYNYNPEYLQFQQNFYSRNSTNSRIESGISHSFTSNIVASLTAKVTAEKSDNNFAQPILGSVEDGSLKLTSYALTENINWRSKNDKHLVYLSSENGFYISPLSGDRELQLRTSASWSYQNFGITGYYQKGNFTFSDIYNTNEHGSSISRFNIAPSFRKSFMNNRLKTQADINFNHDSKYGSNLMYSGNASYDFSKFFSGFVNAQFYRYSSSFASSSYSNLQAGISYNLPDGTRASAAKKGTINAFIFYDNNANGVFDEGDSPASGTIINIGGVSFVSLKDGRISYRKVPYGRYSVNVPSNEWFAITPSELILESKEVLLSTPLQRGGKITGRFVYKYDKRTNLDFEEKYGGLRIWAIASDGTRTEALSNALGQFTLLLPVGEYLFQVDDTSLPKNVIFDLEPMKISVSHDKPVQIGTIELGVKQQKIEIKRFSAD